MSAGAAVLWVAEAWLYVGAVVATVFLAWGIDRVEENARGAHVFRPLLVPGILLLWPLVLARWLIVERSGVNATRRDLALREAHAVTWRVLAVAIPLVLIAALLVRQSPPRPGDGAVQISRPTATEKTE